MEILQLQLEHANLFYSYLCLCTIKNVFGLLEICTMRFLTKKHHCLLPYCLNAKAKEIWRDFSRLSISNKMHRSQIFSFNKRNKNYQVFVLLIFFSPFIFIFIQQWHLRKYFGFGTRGLCSLNKTKIFNLYCKYPHLQAN